MSSLKIHFLTQFIHQQGTYFRFHNLAIGLTKLGHQVTVFGCDHDTTSKEREEIRDGVKYHIVPEFKGTSLFGTTCHPLTVIRRCFIDYPPCDVAHLFQPFPSAALPWNLILPKKAKVLFYDWDDLWSDGFLIGKSKLFREYWVKIITNYLEQQLPQRAVHVTTCSQFLADLSLQRNARKATVIHNGFWPFVIPDKKVARESLGLDPQALYIGFMGRTIAELSWCFEAFEINLYRYEDLRFALCGPSEQVLEKVPNHVQQKIDFLGNLPPFKTREFAAAIDLGLLPLEDNSFNQSRFPIKYAEYMAAATPVLCSDVGECAKISNNLPWVIKAGTTKQQWINAFDYGISLLKDNTLKKVNIDIIENLFSWNLISKNLLELYFLELSDFF